MLLNTNEEKQIFENSNHIKLDLNNIPQFLRDYENTELKLFKKNEQIENKVYKYLNVNDIQIFLEPCSKSIGILEKNTCLIPLCRYLKEDENLNLFSRIINNKEIEQVEKEQKIARNVVPFKVEYETDNLWKIYYSEELKNYFLLVTDEDKNYSALFYLLKKQIECFESKKSQLIYVPVQNLDYSKKYLTDNQMSEIEKYIWLFTKEWPKIYEVLGENNEVALHFVGTTCVYDKIKSYYKIKLNTQNEVYEFYTLIKTLFILKTELPHHYDFATQINEKGELIFEYNNKLINYNNLLKFIKDEYNNYSQKLKLIFKEKEKLEIKLDNLKNEEIEKNKEYLFKEKQVSTYLNCRKSIIGKIKYFFNTKNIKSKRTKEKSTKSNKILEQNEMERSISNSIIEAKNIYNTEDLVKICIEVDRIEMRVKNAQLDINVLEDKIKVVDEKIKNAAIFIERIEEHRKSIFEFWKFSNKDIPLGLNTGMEYNNNNIEEKTSEPNEINVYLCSNDKLNIAETKTFYLNLADAMNHSRKEKISLSKVKIKTNLDIKENQNTIEIDMSNYKVDLKKQKIFRTNYEEDNFNFKERIICVYEYELK